MSDYTYRDMVDVDHDCDDCVYEYVSVMEQPCDDCCAAHCAFEPKAESE